MNTQTKVVFPPPPPTTNELTAQQRAQLVRKTRKIEQLLGAAPRLVDTSLKSSPIHVTLSYGPSQRRLTKRQSSVDSTSSVSSNGSLPSPVNHPQRTSTLSSNLCSIRSRKSTRHSTSSITSMFSIEGYAHDNTAPLLRLAVESLTLETIPASPDPTHTSFADSAPQPRTHSRSSSRGEAASSVFPLTPKPVPAPRSSVVVSSKVVIASPNSLRKQKMDRLRKKLGTGVPLDLVFPKENAVRRSEDVPSLNLDKECPPLPPPNPRLATKKTTGRIASSRDSISDSASIHRARRQSHASSSSAKQGSKHKKTRSAPLPAIPHAKERLSFIIESPDEHGSAGCSEEFGLSSVSTHESELTSGWLVSSHDTEIKFWSTRRGYEGWNKLAPISTYSLSSSDDGSSDYSISPVSPASSTSPVSPESPEVSLPATERKRRPSSYRKPPPAFIPSD